MASPDHKDTRPAKKMKMEDEIPNPQDGTNNGNLEHPERIEYVVLVELEKVRQIRASGGNTWSFFCEVMKDAGCSESQLLQSYSRHNFVANLTPEEANKLAGLDSVKRVKPRPNGRWIMEFVGGSF